jgi:hypothetical protein
MAKRFVILLFALVLCPLAARAMTPDQIASAPRSFNAQHVEVTGRVAKLRTQRLPNGTSYLRFSLCAARCVQAIFFGASAITDGQTITVHGVVRLEGSWLVYHPPCDRRGSRLALAGSRSVAVVITRLQIGDRSNARRHKRHARQKMVA